MNSEPFPQVVRRLAAEQGKSLELVGYEAWDLNVRGTSSAFLKKVLYGDRRGTAALFEAVAKVLSVPPTAFAEYRLLKVRESLDERIVGLDQAVANLELLEAHGVA